jgi:hypothetical protein
MKVRRSLAEGWILFFKMWAPLKTGDFQHFAPVSC